MHRVQVHRLGNSESKTCLLCLHGGPGMDYSYFLPFLKPLADQCELAFYRQHQNSEESMPELVAELSNVIGSMANKRIVLLGHSFGSALALEYIRQHGEETLQGLILVAWLHDSSFLELGVKHYTDLFRQARQSEKRIEQSRQGLSANELLRLKTTEWAKVYFNPSFESQGREILSHVQFNAKAFNRLYAEYLNRFDLKPIITNLNLPTLSIYGEDDHLIHPEYIERGNALNPRVHTVRVNPGGHFPFVENPKVFNEAVTAFLKEIDK